MNKRACRALKDVLPPSADIQPGESGQALKLLRTLSLALILAGCGGPEPGPSVVQGDSAGVAIVRSGAALHDGDAQWRLSPDPMLHIGVLEGPEAEQFTRIGEALWLSDGRIAGVNLRNPPEVRIFTADGRHEVSMGGSGEGPGELRRISLAARLPGDTLLIHDFGSARLTYFDPGGGLVRTQPLQEVAGDQSIFWYPLGVFEDGTLLFHENFLYPDALPGRRRSRRAVVRTSSTGELIDTLLVVTDVEYFAEEGEPSAVLFGLRVAWRLHAGRFYVAPGDEFGIDVYDSDGVLRRRIRRDYTRPPVRPEHLDAELEHRLSNVETEEERERVAQTLRELQVAEYLPAHGLRLLVDSAGNIWLKHYEPPGSTSRRWSVFGPDGRFLSEVPVPSNFRITDVRDDRVLGVWTDALDVPALRVYELIRDGG